MSKSTLTPFTAARWTSAMRPLTPSRPSVAGSRDSHIRSSPLSTSAPINMSPAIPLAGSPLALFISITLIGESDATLDARVRFAQGIDFAPGPRMAPERYDVAVVGGGPAGLSAALWLARYLHKVVVIDSGDPRNWETCGINGYLGHQGIRSPELRKLGRTEGEQYGAQFVSGIVDTAAKEPGELFEICMRGGKIKVAHRIMLAIGIRDVWPDIPGLD